MNVVLADSVIAVEYRAGNDCIEFKAVGMIYSVE